MTGPDAVPGRKPEMTGCPIQIVAVLAVIGVVFWLVWQIAGAA